jgi:predicted MFS family arabinose efflux permease
MKLPYRAAFAEREFRIFISARMISQLGNQATVTVLAFATLSIGGGIGGVGLVLGAEALSLALFLLVGGVIGDRFSRRRVMILADSARFLSQGLSAALLLAGVAHVWELAVLQVVTGAGSAIYMPSLSAIGQETVPPELRKDANALQSLVAAVSTIAGPGLGALLAVLWTPGAAMAADALTFLFSAALLTRLRIGGQRTPAEESALSGLVEGWHEFRSRRWVWSITALCAIALMASYTPLMVLGPVIAKSRLGGVSAWAVILVGLGVGGVIGGFAVSWLKPRKPLAWVVWGTTLMLPLMVLLAVHAPVWTLAIAAVAMGFDTSTYWTFWWTALQQRVPDDVLSRVMSFDWVGTYALGPLAYLLVYPVVLLIGISGTLFAGAGLVLVATIATGAIQEVRTFTDLEAEAATEVPGAAEPTVAQ